MFDISENSHALKNIHYAIRGPVLHEALRLEKLGQKILKLNIGNTYPFGINADDDVLEAIRDHLPEAQGYVASQGIVSARESIAHYYKENYSVSIDSENIYLGNGVSELISMSMSSLLNPGDEVLLPSPDYPLWSAMVRINHGAPRYYQCELENEWVPTIESMEAQISERTRAIVIISPNNPTGAVYPPAVLKQIVALAEKKKILLFSDEIYERIVYGERSPCPLATLAGDNPCVFYGGLSKTYRAPGFRSGWMCVHDPKNEIKNLLTVMEKLSSLRLCSGAIVQPAIAVALRKKEEIDRLMRPGGVFYDRVNAACEALDSIEGVDYVRPKGSLYIFPRLSKQYYTIKNSEQFVLDFLREKQVLLVPGTGFNYPKEEYFRIVCLPVEEELQEAIFRLKDFLRTYRQ